MIFQLTIYNSCILIAVSTLSLLAHLASASPILTSAIEDVPSTLHLRSNSSPAQTPTTITAPSLPTPQEAALQQHVSNRWDNAWREMSASPIPYTRTSQLRAINGLRARQEVNNGTHGASYLQSIGERAHSPTATPTESLRTAQMMNSATEAKDYASRFAFRNSDEALHKAIQAKRVEMGAESGKRVLKGPLAGLKTPQSLNPPVSNARRPPVNYKSQLGSAPAQTLVGTVKLNRPPERVDAAAQG